MPVITMDYKHQIKEELLEGSYGFLSESQLSKNKSMFVNVHFGGKEKLLYSILCSVYGISYATERGVNLYTARGKVRKNMLFRLKNPKTWKNFSKYIKINKPELLIDFDFEKLDQFELENEIALHLLCKDPTRLGESGYVTYIRTPGWDAYNFNKHAYVYILQRKEVPQDRQKYYGASFDFVSVLDYNRFTCSNPFGCNFCEEASTSDKTLQLEAKSSEDQIFSKPDDKLDILSLSASMESLSL